MEDLEVPERTRTQQLLTPLQKTIVDKPPYTSGTLRLPNDRFSLYYKETKDGNDARYINLASATYDELEQLAQACLPASFGVNQKEVLDETYRKAGKMDPERFGLQLHLEEIDLMKIIRSYLLEGVQSTKSIVAELYKLNVYGEGSFFKPHVDTPRSEKMFGSLVIVFPTPHEGGALLLRHGGQEWIFDSGRELAVSREPSIGYVTFFSDVEHEVAPVISGHRVTLTYNLYFDDGEGTTSSNSVSEHLSLPPTTYENAFREAFKALIENPEFMPDGGTLGFGMSHIYPIAFAVGHPNPLEPIYGTLKGSDAIVYQTARALGFQPVLYMFYEIPRTYGNLGGVVIDKVIDSSQVGFEEEIADTASFLIHEGGVEVCQAGTDTDEYYDEEVERVEWVTPVKTFNRHQSAFLTYGNEPSMDVVYADLCMFVRIGKVGERMAYPSVSQLKKEWERGRGRGV